MRFGTAKLCQDRLGPRGIHSDFSGEVIGVSVPSGVADQPMNDKETLLGATRRMGNAAREIPDADFWIGLEGGCEDSPSGMQAFARIVVKSRDGLVGKGKTGTFFLPPPIADLVRQGVDLGKVDDIVFGRVDSKRQNGPVGLLTSDAITRTSFYAEWGVVLAPFKNRELFVGAAESAIRIGKSS